MLFQGLDLIGHQRDQRRDDQAHTGAQDGGDLVADALAAAGRQHGQGVAALKHLFDDARLEPTEILVAPHPFQQHPRILQGGRVVGEGGVIEHAGCVPLFGGVCHPEPMGKPTDVIDLRACRL